MIQSINHPISRSLNSLAILAAYSECNERAREKACASRKDAEVARSHQLSAVSEKSYQHSGKEAISPQLSGKPGLQ